MKIKKYKYQILLVFIGLVWITILNYFLQLPLQTIVYNDAANYIEAAQFLYQKQQVHYFRPSFLAFLQGIPFIFGATDDFAIYQFSYFLNLFCWLGFLVVFYELLKDYFNQTAAFLLALCPLFFFGAISLLCHPLSENVFMFVIILAFYYLSKYFKNSQYFNLSFSLSLFLIAILIRPGILVFSIIIILAFLHKIIQHLKNKANVLLLISGFLIVFHCFQMKQQYSVFTVSFIDSYTYYNYLGTRAEFLKTSTTFNQGSTERNQYLLKKPYAKFPAIARRDLQNQILNNPKNLLKAYFDNILENIKTGSTFLYDLQNINNTVYFDSLKLVIADSTKWTNRILSILGILLSTYFIARFYKKQNSVFFIAVYVLYTVITSAVSCCQGDRFHLTFFPLVIFMVVFLRYRNLNHLLYNLKNRSVFALQGFLRKFH